MKVYVANYTDESTVESQQDDPEVSWETEGLPRVAGISLRLTDEWIRRMMEEAEEEFRSPYLNSDGTEPEDEDDRAPKVKWELNKDESDGYTKRRMGQLVWSYNALDFEGDPEVWLIIYEMEATE